MRHRWNVSEQEAISIQQAMSREVETTDRIGTVQYIAGVDISSTKDDRRIWATAVEFQVSQDKSFSEMFHQPIDYSNVMIECKFPYIPGLLAFREGPAAVLALEYLKFRPDLIIFDAHGYSHPRRCGLASHLGVYLDIPSIGCAKSLLPRYGILDEEHSEDDMIPIIDGDQLLGKAVITKIPELPVYVSSGHRVSLDHAVRIVRWLTGDGKWRLPATTEWSHLLANQFRQNST